MDKEKDGACKLDRQNKKCTVIERSARRKNNAGTDKEVKQRIAMAKVAFNRKRSIFCGPLEKELRKRLVKCFVWCCMVQRPGHYDGMSKNNWKHLRCGYGEDGACKMNR